VSGPLLEIRGLRAAYGKIEALKGVDLDINNGEIVALIGANGAGKSTLMMTIFGKPRRSTRTGASGDRRTRSGRSTTPPPRTSSPRRPRYSSSRATAARAPRRSPNARA